MKKNFILFTALTSLPALLSGCSLPQHKGTRITLEKGLQMIEEFTYSTATATEKITSDIKEASGLFAYQYENGTTTEECDINTIDTNFPLFDKTIGEEDCEIYLSESELEFTYTVKPDTLQSVYSSYLETLEGDEKTIFEQLLTNFSGDVKITNIVNLSGLPISIKYQMNVYTSAFVENSLSNSAYRGSVTVNFSDYKNVTPVKKEVLPETIPAASSAEANYDGKTWLSNIPSDMPISNINLPGTHDGTTGCMNPIAGLGLPKTQDMSIDDQFNLGVRYIDMRLLYTASKDGDTIDKLGFGHGDAKFGAFYSYKSRRGATLGKKNDRLSFRDAFDWGKKFLDDHSSEFLIYQIKGEVDCKDDRKKHSEVYTTTWMEEQAYNFARDLASKYPNRVMVIDNMSESTDVYTYGDVKGKIIYSIDINGGHSHSMYGSKSAVCDTYNLGFGRKIDDLTKTFDNSTVDISRNKCKFWNYNESENNYNPRIIHCSCYRDPAHGLLNPKSCSNRVNPFVKGRTFNKGKKYGWVLFDYVDRDLVTKIVESNPNI